MRGSQVKFVKYSGASCAGLLEPIGRRAQSLVA